MISFPLLKWTLVCSNGLIFAFLIILMCEHYYAGNSLKSWSFIFYILSFAWLILKGIFWLLTVLTGRTWGAFEFYVLYWVPVPLEICSFMLVPLFFVNMLYPRRWNYYKIYIRPVYIAITCGLTILTIVWSLLAAVSLESQHKCILKFLNENEKDADDDMNGMVKTCFRTEYTGDMFRSITATCFLFLSFTQGWFGVKLHHLNDWQQLGMIATQKENLTYLNVFLCFSFISRVVYQVLAIFWDFRFANIPLNGTDDVQFLSFLMIVLWDYLPTVLLLLYVVSPSLQGGIFAPRARSGSRAFSIDESDPYGRGRDRSDTGFTSDDGGRVISSGGDGDEEGVCAYLQRVGHALWSIVTGGGRREDAALESDEHGGVKLSYGTDVDNHSLFYGGSNFHGSPLRNPNENDPLMSSNRYPGIGWQGDGSGNSLLSIDTAPQDALQRFEQAPLLPSGPHRNSFRGGAYPTTQQQQQQSSPTKEPNGHVDSHSHDTFSKQHPVQPPYYHHQQHQHQHQHQHQQNHIHQQQLQQQQMFAPSQNCWGRNNSDANFDPDLYAFSAIPRHRSSSSVDSGSNNNFSPLDMQLQRDTSAQKYAAYAPHAPPASTFDPSSGSASSFNKSGNAPSALDNALASWKRKPQQSSQPSQPSLRVATHQDEGAGLGGGRFSHLSHLSHLLPAASISPMGHLMSPSAMSNDSSSDFTLTSSSRATPTNAPSSSAITNVPSAPRSTNLHPQSSHDQQGQLGQQQQQGQGQGQGQGRPPRGQEDGDRGQLSSRPTLRNSSGNFLNLANLAQDQHMSDGGGNGNNKKTDSDSGSGSKSNVSVSTTDGNSTNSSIIS